MKQFTILLCLTIASLSFFSCEKAATTGKIRFTNTSNNPYTVYVDGTSHGTVSGNTSADVSNVSVGTHGLEVIQQSGYLFSPTDQTYSVQVIAGETSQCTFP